MQTWLEAKKHYDEHGEWPLYQPFVRKSCTSGRRRRSTTGDVIGEDSEEHCISLGSQEYCNGPLPEGHIFYFKMRAYTENADLGGTDTNEVACATKPDQPDMTYEAPWSGKEVTVTIRNPKTHPIENSRVNVTITPKDKKGSVKKTVLEFTSETTRLPFTFENLTPNQNYEIEAVVILTVDGYGPIVSKAAVESFTATWVILYIGIGVAAGLLAIIVAIVVLIYRNPTAREAIREKREAFGKRRPSTTTTRTTTTTTTDRRASLNDNNNENIYENGAVSLG